MAFSNAKSLKCKIRTHWLPADMAIIAPGNITVPIFTTQSEDTANYILDFTDVKVLFVGEPENWENIKAILPAQVQLVALPGVEPEHSHLKWEDVVRDHSGQQAQHNCQADDGYR